MNTFRPVRSITSFAAGLAGVLVLTTAAAAQAGPQELDWAVGEQPQVVLASIVVKSAGEYQRHLAETGQARVQRASYAPEQLARGATAYGAVVALKDPAFTNSVRWLASDPMARKRIAARVLQNPEFAARFDRTGSAAALINSAMPATGDVSRSLALAALAVLGEAGDENSAAVEGLLVQPPCGAGGCMYAQR